MELPNNYTVIDIETTGLSNSKNEIIELSAVKIRDDKITQTFTSLVKPNGYINSFIQNLTGITNEMVSCAPSIENILDKYIKFIGNDTIVGHNIKFDIGFINNNSKKYYDKEFLNQSIDTCKLAKIYTDLKRKNLETVANHFNIDTTGHHRAQKDCIMTYGIYNAMKNLKINP
jgi:DNA polymerase-3 subunit epsilon